MYGGFSSLVLQLPELPEKTCLSQSGRELRRVLSGPRASWASPRPSRRSPLPSVGLPAGDTPSGTRARDSGRRFGGLLFLITGRRFPRVVVGIAGIRSVSGGRSWRRRRPLRPRRVFWVWRVRLGGRGLRGHRGGRSGRAPAKRERNGDRRSVVFLVTGEASGLTFCSVVGSAWIYSGTER